MGCSAQVCNLPPAAREQAFDSYRFRQWRWFWDFGGGIFTDLMVHWIDVVHWFLDLDHPASACSIGDYYSAKDVWETPDTVQTLMRYPDKNVQVYFEGTFSSNRNGFVPPMFEILGDPLRADAQGRVSDVPFAVFWLELLARLGIVRQVPSASRVLARLFAECDDQGIW